MEDIKTVVKNIAKITFLIIANLFGDLQCKTRRKPRIQSPNLNWSTNHVLSCQDLRLHFLTVHVSKDESLYWSVTLVPVLNERPDVCPHQDRDLRWHVGLQVLHYSLQNNNMCVWLLLNKSYKLNCLKYKCSKKMRKSFIAYYILTLCLSSLWSMTPKDTSWIWHLTLIYTSCATVNSS